MLYHSTHELRWWERLCLRFIRPAVERIDGHVIWYKPLRGRKYVYGFYPYQQHFVYPGGKHDQRKT